MVFRALLMVSAGMLLFPDTISAQPRGAPRRCPADPQLAQLVSGSDLIVTARPTQNVGAIIAVREPAYVSIPLEAEAFLKGDRRSEDLSLRYFVGPGSYQPSPDALLAVAGRPSVLFLTLVEGDHYFAGYSPRALGDANAAALEAIGNEVARQTAILDQWRINRSLPHFSKVRRLIRELGNGSPGRQRQIFRELEALGSAGVPAMVALMDDRRPLVEPAISLVNKAPDAFEGVRHYGPEQVVDALAAILSQITSVSFGAIYNGASDPRRRAAVDGWRVYAADLACSRKAAERSGS